MSDAERRVWWLILGWASLALVLTAVLDPWWAGVCVASPVAALARAVMPWETDR